MAFDPVFSTNPGVGAMERHRGRIEQTHENSARYAMAYESFDSVGVGEFDVAEGIRFGCKFQSKPIVAYGFSIDNMELVKGFFPRCSGGVREWMLDDQGYYIGAFIYFCVDLGFLQPVMVTGIAAPVTTPTDAETATAIKLMSITHDFTFTAIAIKDLPEDVLMQA